MTDSEPHRWIRKAGGPVEYHGDRVRQRLRQSLGQRRTGQPRHRVHRKQGTNRVASGRIGGRVSKTCVIANRQADRLSGVAKMIPLSSAHGAWLRTNSSEQILTLKQHPLPRKKQQPARRGAGACEHGADQQIKSTIQKDATKHSVLAPLQFDQSTQNVA